jgi:hypothetical protein
LAESKGGGVNIYLALQVFSDGRVMFRRWSPDCQTVHIPGGTFQKQTIEAFRWLHAAGMPEWDQGPNPSEFCGSNFVPAFEVMP